MIIKVEKNDFLVKGIKYYDDCDWEEWNYSLINSIEQLILRLINHAIQQNCEIKTKDTFVEYLNNVISELKIAVINLTYFKDINESHIGDAMIDVRLIKRGNKSILTGNVISQSITSISALICKFCNEFINQEKDKLCVNKTKDWWLRLIIKDLEHLLDNKAVHLDMSLYNMFYKKYINRKISLGEYVECIIE